MKETNPFSQELWNTIIVNIPHSSCAFPYGVTNYANLKNLFEDVLVSTDWCTDKIFSINDISTIKSEISRLFMDTERLIPDDMDKIGRGFYYTQDSIGYDLRDSKDYALALSLYTAYQDNFAKKVDDTLAKYSSCLIFDTHSFNKLPLPFEKQDINRPDICIGTDSFHTPDWLVDQVVCFYKARNFTVKVNDPYSGAFVPQKFYLKDKRVYSIMIEVNKKLYMKDYCIDNKAVSDLNIIFQRLIENLH